MNTTSTAIFALMILSIIGGLFYYHDGIRDTKKEPTSLSNSTRSDQYHNVRKGYEQLAFPENNHIRPRVDLRSTDSYANPTFVGLSQAADRGDTRAACMLGTLLGMCNQLDKSIQIKDDLIDSATLSSPGGESERILATRASNIENALQKYASFCTSLDPQAKNQSFERMLQAVKLGSPRAAVRFFLQPQIKTEMGSISFDRAAQYQRYAIDGLNHAATRGNSTAMYYLFNLLATGHFENSEVVVSSQIERSKAIALGRAIAPTLDPITLSATQETLQKLERDASPRELSAAMDFSFYIDPDANSLDGLPDPAEEIEHCINN